jgi:hypothetical protein
MISDASIWSSPAFGAKVILEAFAHAAFAGARLTRHTTAFLGISANKS